MNVKWCGDSARYLRQNFDFEVFFFFIYCYKNTENIALNKNIKL